MRIHSITKAEWVLLSRRPALWIALAALVLGGLLAGLEGARRVERERERLARAQEAGKERLARLERRAEDARGKVEDPSAPPAWGPRHPAFVGRQAQPLELEVSASEALVVGVAELVPRTYEVTTDVQRSMREEPVLLHPAILQLGRFDLAFVFVTLLPILVLVSSFDLLSSERASGRLRLLQAQGVSVRRLLWGKLTARFAFLSVGIVATLLAAVVAAGIPLAAGPELTGVLLILLGAFAYGVFWLMLASGLSTLASSRPASALSCTVAYVVLVIVVPGTVSLLGRTLAPVPTRVSLIRAEREATRQAEQEKAKLLQAYLYDHPELSTELDSFDEFFRDREIMASRIEDLLEPVRRFHRNAVDRQVGLVDGLRFLSPATTFQAVLEEGSGTSRARFEDFRSDVQAFANRWRDFFTPRILERQPVDDLEALPRFESPALETATVWDRSLPSLLGLAVMILAAAIFGSSARARSLDADRA